VVVGVVVVVVVVVSTSSVVANVEIFKAAEIAQLIVNVFEEIVKVLLRIALDFLHGLYVVGRGGPLGGHGRHVHMRDEKGLANGGTVMLTGALVAMAASTNFEEERAVDPWDWHQEIIEEEEEESREA
jgi:hypothetical protein